MIYSTDKNYRWKLFEHYSACLILKVKISPIEYQDFLYLKLYFAEDYIRAKLKPWIPSFLTRLAR